MNTQTTTNVNEIMMRKALIDLDMSSNTEYFDYCADSHANGQFSQCRELFEDMPNEYQHEMIEYFKDAGVSDKIREFYIKLF
jgi:hypothetical protein